MDILHSNSQGAYKPYRPGRPQPDDNWPYATQPADGNDPKYGIRNPKFQRHIFISRDQLFYDIDAQVAMLNASRRKEDGTENDSLANATTTYRQQFCRWIDNYILRAKGVMSAFVLEPFKTTKLNSVSQKEEVDIMLVVPEWYDDTVFDQLCAAVHDYVVNATLYEFFAITISAKDPVTISKQELMADALADIRKYVNASKPGRIRKPLKPF